MSNAPPIWSAADLAGEREIDGVSVLFAVGAADADRVSVDRSGHFARHELALVKPAEVVPLLREVQDVV